MTSDQYALLKAIILQPKEDMPRLAYADEIEETDPDRAALIRTQVELANIRPLRTIYEEIHQDVVGVLMPVDRIVCGFEWPARYHVLQHRERELWCGGSWRWFQFNNLRPVDTQQPCYHQWIDSSENTPLRTICTRGFVSHITCTAEDFLKHADQLVWNPEMAVSCPTCRPPEYRSFASLGGNVLCPQCHGDGAIPRPCPLTAQPIEKLVLTTLLDFNESPGDYLRDEHEGTDSFAIAHAAKDRREHRFDHSAWHATNHEGRSRMVLEAEFPGIEIEFRVSSEFSHLTQLGQSTYHYDPNTAVAEINPQPMIPDPVIQTWLSGDDSEYT